MYLKYGEKLNNMHRGFSLKLLWGSDYLGGKMDEDHQGGSKVFN